MTHLTDDEDGYNGDKHQRHVVLATLPHVHAFPVGTWPAHGQNEAGVDGRQSDEWHNAHDGQVEPRVVDAHIDGIRGRPGALDHHLRYVRVTVCLCLRSVLEPAWNVVESRHDAHDADHKPSENQPQNNARWLTTLDNVKTTHAQITCFQWMTAIKFMFTGLVQIAMYHYNMYVKVAYDNFDNKRKYEYDDEIRQRANSNPCMRRHSRWKLGQELKWKIIKLRFLKNTHAKMASRKRETYQTEQRMYCLYLNWTGR